MCKYRHGYNLQMTSFQVHSPISTDNASEMLVIRILPALPGNVSKNDGTTTFFHIAGEPFGFFSRMEIKSRHRLATIGRQTLTLSALVQVDKAYHQSHEVIPLLHFIQVSIRVIPTERPHGPRPFVQTVQQHDRKVLVRLSGGGSSSISSSHRTTILVVRRRMRLDPRAAMLLERPQPDELLRVGALYGVGGDHLVKPFITLHADDLNGLIVENRLRWWRTNWHERRTAWLVNIRPVAQQFG